MTAIRFIHAADFHLDAPFRGGRQGYGQIRRADVRQVFTSMITLALAEKVHLLLLCGDLFEQDGVTRDTLAFLQRELRRLNDTQVVLLPGNHDPLSVNSWYHAVSWPAHVHLLPVAGTRAAILDLPALGIHLAGFGFSGVVQDAPDFTSLPAPRPDRLNLLLLHGSLDAPPSARAYHPVTTDQLRQTGYDYVALGHYHHAFILPGTPTIANPGSPEPLGFDEPDAHGVLLGEMSRVTSGVQVQVRPVALARREYVARALDVTDMADPESLRFQLAGLLHDLDPSRHLPLVRLTGTPMEPPDTTSLTEWFDDSWLLYRLVDDTYPPLHPHAGLSAGSLAGVFCDRMDRRISEAEVAGEADRVEMLRQARRAGLEALAYGAVHLVPDRQGG